MSVSSSRLSSQQIRARLAHPVIDADGHQIEFVAPIEDYVRTIGGTRFAVSFRPSVKNHITMSPEEYRDTRTHRMSHWHFPTRNTLDRATAALPRLLYERMDDIGLDFTVLFTTFIGADVYRVGSGRTDAASDPEVRRIKLRAANAYRMDMCKEFASRMTPAGDIPMNSPQEAIEDLDFAVNKLGFKAISVAAEHRPIPSIHRKHPELFPQVYWVDNFGLDSAYDYDPFWARCLELKVPVMFHSNAVGFHCRSSPSQFTYNHIGHFADAGEALCKSLFLGGVTRRFPALRIAFLEGGVAWGVRLYNDLVAHWEKRNREAMQALNPANLDRKLFVELHARYGGKIVQDRLHQVLQVGSGVGEEPVNDPSYSLSHLDDDFAACGLEQAEDIPRFFAPNFFFGCEADDRLGALAFNPRSSRFGVRLNPVFGSDIGHWDVPDMTQVLAEAYELVEHGDLTDEDLRDLLFTNSVKLLAGANPKFFKGTVVEKSVDRLVNANVGG